jgi:hypothetical protein
MDNRTAVRVVLATNSQGTEAGVDVSYPFLVAKRLRPRDDVHVLAMTGFTVRDFNLHAENITGIRPDLVALQVGIVECARRILSVREKDFLRALPGGRRITKALHERRRRVIQLRERLGRTTRLFSPEEFREEVRTFRDKVTTSGAQLLLLEIPRFSDSYADEHFPFVNVDIELFNRVLRDEGAVPFLEEATDNDAIWQTGTVHLNQLGHQVAADELLSAIDGRRAGA